jgi:hypothetical protein
MKKREIEEAIKQMNESEVDSKLMEFSETFKPIYSRPFLDMQGNHTSFDYKKGYLEFVWTWKIYVESGYDEDVANDLGLKEILTEDLSKKCNHPKKHATQVGLHYQCGICYEGFLLRSELGRF